MANHIQVPPDSGGKKVAAREYSQNGHTRHRNYVEDGLTAPRRTFATEAVVSAGGSAVLQSDAVTVGRTGRLMGVYVASSVSLRADLRTMSEGVPSVTDRVVGFGWAGEWYFRPPARDFLTARGTATPGFDGFRVMVTNLDAARTADVYATFFWDEDDSDDQA